MILGGQFAWDDAKEVTNLAKHGVSFREAVEAFADLGRVILEDTAHSHDEPRWYCLGSVGGDILTVRFTRRGRQLYETQNPLH